jgi:hypothetical protein
MEVSVTFFLSDHYSASIFSQSLFHEALLHLLDFFNRADNQLNWLLEVWTTFLKLFENGINPFFTRSTTNFCTGSATNRPPGSPFTYQRRSETSVTRAFVLYCTSSIQVWREICSDHGIRRSPLASVKSSRPRERCITYRPLFSYRAGAEYPR